MKFALVGADGRISRTLAGAGKIKGLLPGDEPRKWEDAFDVGGVSGGRYMLRATNATLCALRKRFLKGGVNALFDEPRPGAPRKIGDEQVERVIVETLERQPKGATHWSTRMTAQKLGFSQSAVSRIWRAFGLKPRRAGTHTLSKDPLFVEKVRDVVGLYLFQ